MAVSDIRLNELVRKAIHLCSAAIPLLYWFYLDRSDMLKGVSLISLGFLAAEFIRFHSDPGKRLFVRIFGAALRDHEQHRLTGATYVFAGAVVNIFLFPKEIAVPALLVLSISDTLAALVGIPFGSHKFLKKSLEGSLTFFAATLAILSIFYPEHVALIILISGIVTLAEAYPLGLDDNFLIPSLTGLLLLLLSYLI